MGWTRNERFPDISGREVDWDHPHEPIFYPLSFPFPLPLIYQTYTFKIAAIDLRSPLAVVEAFPSELGIHQS